MYLVRYQEHCKEGVTFLLMTRDQRILKNFTWGLTGSKKIQRPINHLQYFSRQFKSFGVKRTLNKLRENSHKTRNLSQFIKFRESIKNHQQTV